MAAQKVFDELAARLKADPSVVKKVYAPPARPAAEAAEDFFSHFFFPFACSNGVYLFTIDGKNHWTVDLKNGGGSVKQGEHGKVDCTVLMAEKDFVELMTGKLNGQSAFMSGKLKIKGNMNLAMKLGELSKAAPKAKL